MHNDLESMKHLWQQSPSASPQWDDTHLGQMLRKRSRDAFSRLRTHLLIEAAFGVLVMGLFVYAFVRFPQTAARMAILQALSLISPLALFYYFGWRHLSQSRQQDGPLKELLRASVQYWERSLRLYFWGGALMLPALFITVLWWRSEAGIYPIRFFTGSPWAIAVKAICAWAIACAAAWGLIWLSYGKYVRKLKDCLQEMER
ncbi:MAG TPA: hypothetical protein PK971_10545 [Saprospiraceae bacterium]|nr:hypothetical protein [Saprospiraceae bacterium]HNG89217.1 hypothetical protein [Saprospiraceae bacterium]